MLKFLGGRIWHDKSSVSNIRHPSTNPSSLTRKIKAAPSCLNKDE
ncbi:hypothetical protein AO366_0925 [Moraxella catarrhalis]|uniref:Uncharacterized protein n=1 Tax=Moraxella catarrhalis TaxID=480 RepID=A0A198XPW9_MORCA|nr:hypothetical protein AO380_1312 [Moraxella catarrhalis]OAV08509.1 hypothetical protein AO377_1707 [Moraxella catarrhalis]OAV25476.1 hypothetical protein AO370_0946 [Moraxella catarrhalis]OAV32177.1 hypothetical protein AO367_0162 [Moraxella catarrhalis]OAV33650.1 hypothetical protein AO366_0925 [Moraxella catarrhalis]